MPVAYPSIRVQDDNPTHHLWNNNGTWWIHFTVHFDHRKRRIRRSLKTRSLAEAIEWRDHLLAKATLIGEVVPDRAIGAATEPPSTRRRRAMWPCWPNDGKEHTP